MPLLMVTGRTVAFGNTKRQARVPAVPTLARPARNHVIGAQPVQPNDRGIRLAPVSTSMLSNMLRNVQDTGRARPQTFTDIIERMTITLEHLRRYAIARSLFKPTTLGRAIAKLGFVQADPIRAGPGPRSHPAPPRYRLPGRRFGTALSKMVLMKTFRQLWRAARAHHALMHPRISRHKWTPPGINRRRGSVFVGERGSVIRARSMHIFCARQDQELVRRHFECEHAIAGCMHYRGLLR